MNNQVFNGILEETVRSGTTISHDDVIFNSSLFNSGGKTTEIRNSERPKKIFSSRESVLTVLLEDQQIKTIFHLFAIILFNFACFIIARDFIEEREYSWHGLIRKGFRNFHIVIGSWFLYYCLTCVIFYCFKTWATIRTEIIPIKSKFKKFLDISAILSISAYYVFSFKMAEFIVWEFQLRPPAAITLLVEQTRMLMKVHAFVRSNVPKVLKYGIEPDTKLVLPNLKHFIFFTFVPTLIYMDEYPRTQKIRWKVVAVQMIEILAIILSIAFLLSSFVVPEYLDFGLRKYTYGELLLKILEICLPSTILMFVSFYLILHQVQNLFAEFLRFGDRMFYRDWWNANDFATYYKKWNVIVHDWLFIYVYSDFCEIFASKIFAKYLTFFVSALIHEWLIIHSLGFFFPLMFCSFFFVGTLFSLFKVPQHYMSNVIMLLFIFYGTGLLFSCYTLELIARNNDVLPLVERLDFYIPRSLTCDCFI